MTTNISIDEYCKDPSEYAHSPGLDNDTKKYWSSLCDLRKELSKNQPSNRGALGKAFPTALGEFMIMMTQPSALEMMGIMAGGIIYLKQVKKALKRFADNGPSEGATAAAEEMEEAGGDLADINASIITSDITADVAESGVDGTIVAAETTSEAVEFTGRAAAQFTVDAMEFLGEVADEAMWVVMALQILGMILDAWDPCHLKSQLSADMLKTFSTAFNKNFRESMLRSQNSTRDSYGHVMFTNAYPIEYFADAGVLLKAKKDYYHKIGNILSMKYINTLEFNSNGQKIVRKSGGRILNKNDTNKIELDFSLGLADQNTVVANWIFRWWPAIIAFLVLIIILFLFIKNRRK